LGFVPIAPRTFTFHNPTLYLRGMLEEVVENLGG